MSSNGRQVFCYHLPPDLTQHGKEPVESHVPLHPDHRVVLIEAAQLDLAFTQVVGNHHAVAVHGGLLFVDGPYIVIPGGFIRSPYDEKVSIPPIELIEGCAIESYSPLNEI